MHLLDIEKAPVAMTTQKGASCHDNTEEHQLRRQLRLATITTRDCYNGNAMFTMTTQKSHFASIF